MRIRTHHSIASRPGSRRRCRPIWAWGPAQGAAWGMGIEAPGMDPAEAIRAARAACAAHGYHMGSADIEQAEPDGSIYAIADMDAAWGRRMARRGYIDIAGHGIAIACEASRGR